MKTTIIILSIFLLTISGVQSAQAQTKEKTIAWIKEKMTKYVKDIDTGRIFVNPCEISWESDTSGYTFTFNPSAATWSVNEKGYPYASKAIIDTGAYIYYGGEGEDTRPENDPKGNELHIENSEPNLAARMAKALNHLATFCNQKKEAF